MAGDACSKYGTERGRDSCLSVNGYKDQAVYVFESRNMSRSVSHGNQEWPYLTSREQGRRIYPSFSLRTRFASFTPEEGTEAPSTLPSETSPSLGPCCSEESLWRREIRTGKWAVKGVAVLWRSQDKIIAKDK